MERWKEEYIKENYPTKNTRKIAEHIGMSYHTVMKFCQINKIYKSPNINGNELDEQKQKLIYKNYEYGDFNSLSTKTGMSKHAISEWARKRGLKRQIDIRRNGTLEPLLSQTLESFYWLGFIAADGYIHKNGSLLISQHEKDKDNIFRMSKYLKTSVYEYKHSKSGYSGRNQVYRINLSDKIIGKKIYDMFEIQPDLPKTYTGISLDFIKNENQAASFLAGFIEGDGYYSKYTSYKIQTHKSWLNTFKDLLSKLPKDIQNINCELKHRKDKDETYCHFDLRVSSSRTLRKFVHNNKLPVSKRKFPNEDTST